MADQVAKTKPKRLSKGGRVHMRRLKQAARKAGTPLPAASQVRRVKPAKASQPDS